MIEDDGKGFELTEQQQGMGLKSALSRIEGLGGRFLIDSKLGRGTIITIILPLVREDASMIIEKEFVNHEESHKGKPYRHHGIKNIFKKRIIARNSESELLKKPL